MKALFIGPAFYNYESEICRKLEEQGYEVDYYSERNDHLSSLTHFVMKTTPKKFDANALYEQQLLHKISGNKYDLFLLIRGEDLSYQFVNKIFELSLNCNAKTVYYTWDSIRNLPNAQSISKLFQRRYTFDLYDSETNENIAFLPLFFINSYRSIKKREPHWDIAIVASYTRERYDAVLELLKRGYSIKHNLYIKKYLRIKQYLFNTEFRKQIKGLISTTTIGHSEIMDIYSKSRAVLDIPSRSQTGLSMRTIECLGCDMKLITTNNEVCTYDFYNSNNIFLLNSSNMSNIDDWLKVEYEPVAAEIKQKYSIDSWIKTVLYGKDGDQSI